MSADPQVSPLKSWLDTGEILFGSDLNSNFDALFDAYNGHTHTEYPDQTAVETISAAWTFSATPLLSHATPARFTGAGWADGDIVYISGGDGSLTRLAKGSARHVLQMNAGATAPQWAGSLLLENVAVIPGGAVNLEGEGSTTYLKSPAADSMGFFTDDIEALRIGPTGNIGIIGGKYIYLTSVAGTGGAGSVRLGSQAGAAQLDVYISDIATMRLDRVISPGETSLSLAVNTIESSVLFLRVLIGESGTGPGGSGRALYTS